MPDQGAEHHGTSDFRGLQVLSPDIPLQRHQDYVGSCCRSYALLLLHTACLATAIVQMRVTLVVRMHD